MYQDNWIGPVADMVPEDARWLVDSQDLGDTMDLLRTELGIPYSFTQHYAGFWLVLDESGDIVFAAGCERSIPYTHTSAEVFYRDGQYSPWVEIHDHYRPEEWHPAY